MNETNKGGRPSREDFEAIARIPKDKRREIAEKNMLKVFGKTTSEMNITELLDAMAYCAAKIGWTEVEDLANRLLAKELRKTKRAGD